MDFGNHRSWDSYFESLSTPLKFGADATEEELDEAFRVLGEANRHFYRKHLATLAPHLRQRIEDRDHSSLSHERHEEAALVMGQFTQYLADTCALPITQQPTMGFYHGDQIVFSVCFDSDLSWSEIDKEVPPFYEGFRIFRERQSDHERLNPPKSEQDVTSNI